MIGSFVNPPHDGMEHCGCGHEAAVHADYVGACLYGSAKCVCAVFHPAPEKAALKEGREVVATGEAQGHSNLQAEAASERGAAPVFKQGSEEAWLAFNAPDPAEKAALKEGDTDSARSFDAREWASAFMRFNAKHNIAADEGAMLSWFANAIMRGWDEHAHRYPPPSEPPRAAQPPAPPAAPAPGKPLSEWLASDWPKAVRPSPILPLEEQQATAPAPGDAEIVRSVWPTPEWYVGSIAGMDRPYRDRAMKIALDEYGANVAKAIRASDAVKDKT